MGLEDGQQGGVSTAAGSETGEIRVSGQAARGMVQILHGFDYLHDGQVYGINVNRLANHNNRYMPGARMYRFVPCRVAAADK